MLSKSIKIVNTHEIVRDYPPNFFWNLQEEGMSVDDMKRWTTLNPIHTRRELSLDDIDSMRRMKETNWDDKEAWGCFKNRRQEDEPLKKKGETRLSIVAWTIAELERWPPPPHATMSLFIYPVRHAVFPVTTGGGSRPCSAEAGAVRLIHCKRHLPAWFVMFPDATRKAWLARNYGPDAAFTLFVYPFRCTVIPQKLCHWCSERGLAQKCG